MSYCGKDGKALVSYAYGYDSDHLNRVTDGKAQKYTIAYNGEKVSAVTYPNGEKENWGYAGGKTTITKKASDGTEVRTNSREYDTKSGKVTKETEADGSVTTYTYGYAKNPYLVTKTTKQTGYEELNDGKVEWKTKESVTETSYDEQENIISETEEDGTETEYTYDTTSEWTEDQPKTEVATKGETVISKENYTYSKTGNLKKEEESYDPSNKSITENTYDGDGNVLESTTTVAGIETSKTTSKYDLFGNATESATTSGDVESQEKNTYDVMGRVTKKTDKETGDSVENSYDVENRLSTATVTKKSGTSGNETVSLTQENLYNGDGQRIQKKEAGEVTNYFYEDGMVSYTTGADTGEKLIQNLSGLEDNVIYAEQKVTGKDGTASAYQDFLYTKDIQGSTSSILNKDTKGELSYEYDDFGETSIHGSSVLKNEICYTGGIYDESTGLYYLNARYYDPENGRFLTEDTYRGEMNDPDTLHLYVYCKNNPINYVDPSGHKWRLFNEIKKMTSEKAKECMERYKSNKKKMEKKKYPVKRGYLYGQYDYSNIEFRETNISDAGCGIVAAHNAMYTCGKKELFVKLVAEYDFNMKSSGRDGIKWSTVASSIRRHGFKIKDYNKQKKFEKKITSTKPGILDASYKTGSGHFAMIRKIGNKFHCYNLTGYSLSYTKYDDFDSIEDILRKITAHFEKGYIISK